MSTGFFARVGTISPPHAVRPSSWGRQHTLPLKVSLTGQSPSAVGDHPPSSCGPPVLLGTAAYLAPQGISHRTVTILRPRCARPVNGDHLPSSCGPPVLLGTAAYLAPQGISHRTVSIGGWGPSPVLMGTAAYLAPQGIPHRTVSIGGWEPSPLLMQSARPHGDGSIPCPSRYPSPGSPHRRLGTVSLGRWSLGIGPWSFVRWGLSPWSRNSKHKARSTKQALRQAQGPEQRRGARNSNDGMTETALVSDILVSVIASLSDSGLFSLRTPRPFGTERRISCFGLGLVGASPPGSWGGVSGERA